MSSKSGRLRDADLQEAVEESELEPTEFRDRAS